MIETPVDRRGINPMTDLRLYKQYRAMLKKEKPDMVITYSIKPNVYAGYACRRLHIPYCVNVQGLGTAFEKPGLSQVVTMMYRTALKGAKTVFFENERNAALFREKKITPEKQQTILSGAGITLDFYQYEAYPENEAFHFLYLGRIMKEKGIDELFYAIRKLHEEYGGKVVLDIVGFFEDEYKGEVEKLVEDGIAVFHGFKEDPRPYYKAADCIVLPSYHEGMSNVLLEAASTGRPVVTSKIPGCMESVEDGTTGYLCQVKNAHSLYQKMNEIYHKSRADREEMGKCARDKMAREFAKDEVLKMTVAKVKE